MNDNEILSFYIEQKEYNSKKARKNKNLYFICISITLLCSILTIPIIAIQNIPIWISIITSSLVAFAQGINNIFNFSKQWTMYRIITEKLKSEYRKYKFNLYEYKELENRNKDILFAERIESIIEISNFEWQTLISSFEEKEE